MEKKVKLLQKNKKAFFNYEISESFECGIALVGSEVKSMREGRFSFQDSWVKIENGSLFLVNFTIEPYRQSSLFNHKGQRPRRILAHKQEIKRMRRKVEEKGFTLIATSMYIKGRLIKVEVSLAKGKTLVDKKNAIKERDLDRQLKRDLKERY